MCENISIDVKVARGGTQKNAHRGTGVHLKTYTHTHYK
jgi:hypothetical protein